MNADVIRLLADTRRLERRLLAEPGAELAQTELAQTELAQTALRLRDSVIRPLAALTGSGDSQDLAAEPAGPADAAQVGPGQASTELWRLAREATALRAAPGASPLLIEATAALQDLACRSAASQDEAAARVTELAALQAGVSAGIMVAPDGPYLVTGARTVNDHLGVPLSVRPQLALCRCGASQSKPYCDGTHARIGFSGAKSDSRVPDHLDAYQGMGATIRDNRGTCAHSGFCTDRLPTVFRRDQDPFVAPSGGRLDEIIRAVRSCPSGALGIAIDDVREAAQADVDREPGIEVSKDGPYRVTGSIPLTGPDGLPEPRNQGASFEHYSLCRCGQSQNKPFCSGMHWYVGFQDPPMPDDPTLFEWLGGFPALIRMTRLFYGKYVPADPLLAPLFAGMSPDHPERVAAWLGETFGGPARYTDAYGGYDHMVGQHLGKGLTEEQRARWAQLIVKSADETGLPRDPEFRAAFVSYIEWGSRIALENSQPGAHPPMHMPVPRWWWVADATPGARVSALAVQTGAETPVIEMPADGQPLSFAAHIKPMFRPVDHQSMKFAFDLWSHDDVSRFADGILGRLRQGSMPCDGAWPAEKIEVFARWVEGGKPA